MNVFEKEVSNAITVTAVYDLRESALHIKEKFRRVSRLSEEPLDFRLRLWRLDLLDLPVSRDHIREEAMNSDLFAVGFAGDGIIGRTDGLVQLLDVWAEARSGLYPALMAIPTRDWDHSHLAIELLRQIAERNAVHFMCSTYSEILTVA